MTINQLIDSEIPVLTATQTVQNAIKVFTSSDLSILPICEAGQYIGLIKKEDLKGLGATTEIPNKLIWCKGKYATSQDNILELIRMGQQYHLEIIPLVDSNSKYLGSVRMENCFQYLVKQTTLGEVGGILVLKVKKNDYSMSEISRIIETEGYNLLHFFINDYDETTHELKITIKVDGLNVESLERTFDRYGYFVDAIFSEKEDINGLKERYDSLMAYLNV